MTLINFVKVTVAGAAVNALTFAGELYLGIYPTSTPESTFASLTGWGAIALIGLYALHKDTSK
jgi:hypothetical protein